MNRSEHIARVLMVAILVLLLGGWLQVREKPAGSSNYLEPRFPSYLKPPQSVEDVMPYARRLVRNKSARGGLGLGVAQKGETIVLALKRGADPMIIEAIRRALQERGVSAQILRETELVGVTAAEAAAYKKYAEANTSEKGFMEVEDFWISRVFADPEAVRNWLKARRPDLYDQLYPPNRQLTPQLKQVREKLSQDNVGKAIQAYLKKHPEAKGVFWGTGGGAGLMRALHPYESKFLGFFTYDNRWEVMSEIPAFPSDVWQLAEEQTMEPIAYVDRMEVTDAEGTNISADITEEMAQRWARGVYQRGHLYMFPTQATGRFAFSVVDYPALQKQWIPREPMSLANGLIAGTSGHYGFNPRLEVHFKNGYVSEVKGGGAYGELMREFLKYPHSNELTYPFHNHPGFWYLYEIGLGTHPKWFRNPASMEINSLIPERNRSGVIHWGTGLRLWHDPDRPDHSKSWMEFTAKYNLPRDHNFHIHNYFPTYRVHLRNANRWVNLVDRGRLTSLDNPEVRALASRYGDPERVLAEDWSPEMPGLNTAGRYEDFARDPWKFAKAASDKAVAGNYEHYYPPLKAPRRGGGK